MKKSIAKLWVKALRSGKYKRTEERLKDGHGFCCLGVLCDISKLGKWGWRDYWYLGERSLLPKKVRLWSGVKSLDGEFLGLNLKTRNLAKLNDSGKSFEQIADIIEKNVERI